MGKWQKAQYSIACQREDRQPGFEWREVKGFMWDVFGLNCTAYGISSFWRAWVVTHVPTGYQITSFERRKDAERFVSRIAGFTDWGALTIADLANEAQWLGELWRQLRAAKHQIAIANP